MPQLNEHNRIERQMVAELIKHGDPAVVEGLARHVFDAETHGPTRPHPFSPHTGLFGLVARRVWALADRFWDNAEGRVIPEVVPIPPTTNTTVSWGSTSWPTRCSTPPPPSWSTGTGTGERPDRATPHAGCT